MCKICDRMLDEFGAEIEHADSRLDSTMKKMAKVLHLSNGKFLSSKS
jgi:syntaxin 6